MAESNGPHDGGTEPDYRFTLANERTFLAWLRTALGLLAGGVAVHQLVPDPSALSTVLAGLCVLLAAVVAASAYPRWRQVQSAMRAGRPLPKSGMLVLLTAGILAITLTAAALVVFS
ncbi:YidH family protein [Amycolatopsis sp. NPDC057786]|uniref:YidH family protein n=1 Tax=Amycolatopsis sp. NPDC057786 TaxID=3346250 RepID=UPI00366E402F